MGKKIRKGRQGERAKREKGKKQLTTLEARLPNARKVKRTKPGSSGSPERVAGFSRHSTAIPGR